MPVSSLSKLLQGRKRFNSHKVMQEVRTWVKAHESAIRGARSRGYTWQEIARSCQELWESSGIFRGVYLREDEGLIRECYHDVKYGRRTDHRKGATSQKLERLSAMIWLSDE